MATGIVVGGCLAGTAFCLRFLIALQRECHRSMICYAVRLEDATEDLVPPKPPESLRVRAHAA